MKRFGAPVCFGLGILLGCVLGGCGGGSRGGGGQNAPGYIISASPTTISIYPGGTANVTVTGQPLNGFSGTISVSFAGLPSGVTASPSNFTFTGSGSQQVQFSAASAHRSGLRTTSSKRILWNPVERNRDTFRKRARYLHAVGGIQEHSLGRVGSEISSTATNRSVVNGAQYDCFEQGQN
jgi:hypothetical protein